jgi:hypothetical protein
MLTAKERLAKKACDVIEAMACAEVVRSAWLVRLSFTHMWEPQLARRCWVHTSDLTSHWS